MPFFHFCILALLPAIIMIIIEGVFTPYLDLVSYQRSFHPTNFTIVTSFHFIASVILLSNSFTNCIIYSIRSEKFKESMVGLRLDIYKFFMKLKKSVNCREIDGSGARDDHRPSVTSMTWLPSSPTLRRDTKRPVYVLTVDRGEESTENSNSTNQTSQFSKPSDFEMS